MNAPLNQVLSKAIYHVMASEVERIVAEEAKEAAKRVEKRVMVQCSVAAQLQALGRTGR